MENKKYSCVDCIWHDQCANDELCDFFDNGKCDLELSDNEIELLIESGRKEYSRIYQKYIQEFNDSDKE